MGGAASSAAASSPPLKFDSMQQGSDDIKRDLSAEVRRRVEQKAEDNAALRNLYLPRACAYRCARGVSVQEKY